jgi:hypothetical protein
MMREGSYEDSPMVYSVVPTPSDRTTRLRGPRNLSESGRPDSEEVLDRVAKSYERERGGGDGTTKRRKRIDEEWKEIRLVGEDDEPRSRIINPT